MKPDRKWAWPGESLSRVSNRKHSNFTRGRSCGDIPIRAINAAAAGLCRWAKSRHFKRLN